MTPGGPALYQRFLESLQSLERFSAARSQEGFLRLRPEDPDMQRLIEAMAWFSARTRLAADTGVYEAIARMAGGTLEGLMTPMPAATLVQAEFDERLVDPIFLPAGARLQMQYARTPPPAAYGAVADVVSRGRSALPQTSSLFTMLEPMEIRPIRVRNARMGGTDGRLRLDVDLAAQTPQKGPRTLRFQVRRLGDYGASVALHTALKVNAYAVTALVPDPAKSRTAATVSQAEQTPCTMTYGPPVPASDDEPGDRRDPFEQLRSFFHFPEQTLSVRVSVPAMDRPWTTLSLSFWLGEGFPDDLTVGRDTFRLNVVPVVNLWSDFAAPIAYDATRDAYPLHAATPVTSAEPVGVLGVYRPGQKMAPLMPFSVGLQADGWELLRNIAGGRPALRVRLADAFARPEKLLVDTLWSQPSLWQSTPSSISVSLHGRHLNGVAFDRVGAVRAPTPSPLEADPVLGLNLMAMRTRRALDAPTLTSLTRILGAADSSPYHEMPGRISHVSLIDTPDPRPGMTRVKPCYEITLKMPVGANIALAHQFGDQLCRLLKGWSEADVDVTVKTPLSASSETP